MRSDGGKVTGCGWLRLRVGSSNRTAGYLRGTDTEELVFGYEVDGSSLTLTYGETLDGGSRPAPGDFTVEVDGAGRSVTGVSVSGSVVTLTLSTAVEHGDTGIRVSTPAGKLELVQSNGETVQCALILMSEWKAKLPDYL